jgi:hypothetical protein
VAGSRRSSLRGKLAVCGKLTVGSVTNAGDTSSRLAISTVAMAWGLSPICVSLYEKHLANKFAYVAASGPQKEKTFFFANPYRLKHVRRHNFMAPTYVVSSIYRGPGDWKLSLPPYHSHPSSHSSTAPTSRSENDPILPRSRWLVEQEKHRGVFAEGKSRRFRGKRIP